MMQHHTINGLGTRGDTFSLHSKIIEHSTAGFQTQRIVIGYKHIQVHKLIIVDFFRILKFQIDGNGKAGSDARLTFHSDVAAHHPDNVSADGHAQSGSLNPVHLIVLGADKGFKNLLKKVFFHADAVILKDEFIASHPCLIRRLFRDGKLNFAAIRRVFHGIAHKIGKDLLDAQAVADHRFVSHAGNVNAELMAVRLNLRIGHGEQIFHQIGKVEFLLAQIDLAGLDLAHIQNFIDEAEQVLAGLGNLLQTVFHTLLFVQTGHGDSGHADDAVHRGANVMGHIGEKVGLSLVGGLRGVIGRLQCHFLLAFLPDQVIYIPRSDHSHETAVLLMDKGHSRLKVKVSAICKLFIDKRIVISVFFYMLQRQLFNKFTATGIRYQFLGIPKNHLRPAVVMFANVLRDSPSVLFLPAVNRNRISIRIDKQNRIVF